MNKLTNIELQQCFVSPQNKLNHNKKLFSFISNKYNLATRILSLGQDQYWKKKLIKNIPIISKPVCLDLACGTGDVTFALAKKFPDAKIYGLDLTQDMINEANKQNKFANLEFICADMCNIPFEGENFDVITGSYALRNCPDLKKALSEIHRILKVNGTFAILDFSKYENKFAQKFQYYVLKFWGSFCGILLHQNHTTYAYIAQSIQYHPTSKELEKIYKDFNFKIIKKKKYFFGIIEIVILKK